MKPETKQAKEAEDNDCDATQEKQFEEYAITRFVLALKKENRDKTVLVNELDTITEGKGIIVSNAR